MTWCFLSKMQRRIFVIGVWVIHDRAILRPGAPALLEPTESSATPIELRS
jgi:hypothetical protein